MQPSVNPRFRNQFEQEQRDLSRIRMIRPKWNAESEAQLTAFMLGYPTTMKFKVIAGGPVHSISSDELTRAETLRQRAALRKRVRQSKTMRSQTAKSAVAAY